MDLEPYRYEDDPESGVRRINRVIATYDGHTHIYQFPKEESDRAVRMVRLHVEEGLLHPYAGLMVAKMIRNAQHEL